MHKSWLIPPVHQRIGSAVYLYVQQIRPAVVHGRSPAPRWAATRCRREPSHCALVLLLLCFDYEGEWRCLLQPWVLWKDAFIIQAKSQLSMGIPPSDSIVAETVQFKPCSYLWIFHPLVLEPFGERKQPDGDEPEILRTPLLPNWDVTEQLWHFIQSNCSKYDAFCTLML